MPTFYDPTADASEAAEALRGLAHASRSIDRPDDLYSIVGNLLDGARSLSQVLDHLATAHRSHQAHAFDDTGSHRIAVTQAQAAAQALGHASRLLDHAESSLNTASQAAGRIAWHSDPYLAEPAAAEPLAAEAAAPEQSPPEQQGPTQRWVSVVFLHGQEADEVLDVIDAHGPDAAIEHLSGWDYGQETTDVAMEHGHVYDQPPAGVADQVTDSNQYRMVHNHRLGLVGLYRLHSIAPADELPTHPAGGLVHGHAAAGRGASPRMNDQLSVRGVTPATTAGSAPAPAGTQPGTVTARADASWFAHRSSTSGQQPRGLGL